LALLSVPALAGSIEISETRYVPEGWTQPEFTRDSQGSISYKPSVPTGFKKRSFGAAVSVDQATVHPRSVAPKETFAPVARRGTEPRQYDLTLKDGTTVRVAERETVIIGEETYVVRGIRKGLLILQATDTKQQRRFSR
jgi:hypothetical protein